MPVLPSYRNQSTDFLCKSIDWFLYEGNTGTLWINLRFTVWSQKPTGLSDWTYDNYIFLLISQLLCMLNVLNMFWWDFNLSLTNVQASVFTDRSSRPEVFCKKGTLKTFAKFTGKHMPYYYIKKETLAQVFSWELGETFKNTFFI